MACDLCDHEDYSYSMLSGASKVQYVDKYGKYLCKDCLEKLDKEKSEMETSRGFRFLQSKCMQCGCLPGTFVGGVRFVAEAQRDLCPMCEAMFFDEKADSASQLRTAGMDSSGKTQKQKKKKKGDPAKKGKWFFAL